MEAAVNEHLCEANWEKSSKVVEDCGIGAPAPERHSRIPGITSQGGQLAKGVGGGGLAFTKSASKPFPGWRSPSEGGEAQSAGL